MIHPSKLTEAPFNIDASALAWVLATFERLSVSEKLGQILLPLCRDLSPNGIESALRWNVGGIHRMPSRSEDELRDSARQAQSLASVPLLMSGDLEMSEKSSFANGTPFPNQLSVAATKQPVAAERMATIAAREGRYCGFNISWSPVLDLAINHRSNVVNTRSFGAVPEQVLPFVHAYYGGAARAGFPRTAKHFPGDGVDDRDQHFVTSQNSQTMLEWDANFGRVWREAITAGIQVVMPGHVTLPAWTEQLGDSATAAAQMPATLNADILGGLLRGVLGFNGVIVSDATMMVGFKDCGPRDELVPRCIEAGCDILLFPEDIEKDLGRLRQGIEDGLLSMTRLDDAVLRILALKAAMGLHRSGAELPSVRERDDLFGTQEHMHWAKATAEASITLVKDRSGLLPINPTRHRRILLAQHAERRSPSGALPDLQIARLLRDAGFEVTQLSQGPIPDAGSFDLGLYVFAEEGVSGKEDLGPQWGRMHGDFPFSMQRLWHSRPSVVVSLGNPFLLYHMPDCPVLVNAYSAIPVVQEAVVEALTGRIPFAGHSPVDASCGLLATR